MTEEVLACLFRDWSPVIGDPHLVGWLTVVLYAVTSAMAVMVLRRGPVFIRPVRWFWGLIAFGMAFLAVNKQLDLQSALTAAGRCLAVAQGWYDDRRVVQLGFIIGLLLAAAALLVAALAVLRRDLGRNAVAAFGLAFVCGFVLVRAVGFHGFDAVINSTLQGLRVNWLLEWTGPLLICLNAAVLLAAARRQGRAVDR